MFIAPSAPGGPPLRTTTPTGRSVLLHRLAIAFAAPALIAGGLASGASAAMPTRMPVISVAAAPAAAPGSPAPAPRRVRPAAVATGHFAIPAVLPTRTTLATTYSAWDEGNACPGLPQTRMYDLTMGSDLVPCGTYIRICLMSGTKCVVVQRRDWGPFTGGRHIDMNLGAVLALGYPSMYEWGVRKVRWERVPAPARTGVFTPAR